MWQSELSNVDQPENVRLEHHSSVIDRVELRYIATRYPSIVNQPYEIGAMFFGISARSVDRIDAFIVLGDIYNDRGQSLNVGTKNGLRIGLLSDTSKYKKTQPRQANSSILANPRTRASDENYSAAVDSVFLSEAVMQADNCSQEAPDDSQEFHFHRKMQMCSSTGGATRKLNIAFLFLVAEKAPTGE